LEFYVEHDIENQLFKIDIDGETAFVSYTIMGDTINFDRTFTPYTLRGKGLAAAVVKKAFEFAKQKKYKVSSGCSYVLTFVKRYSSYQDLMV
jgi:predicted GNAT family acetyltransferase